jgi:hypothetical protein
LIVDDGARPAYLIDVFLWSRELIRDLLISGIQEIAEITFRILCEVEY